LTFDVIIVGAGISGTFMSSLLKQQQKSVLIIEKSGGIGGRFSTKPINSEIVDYGCQYLNPKTEVFHNLINNLRDLGLISEVNLDADKSVFISHFGMNKIPQYLARKTSVITNTMVKKIKRNINRWEVITDTGNFSSTSVVLTMPLHQAETLLQKSEIENFKLPIVNYLDFHTCTFISNNHGIDDIIIKNESFPWICNNSKKGLRNSSDVFTVNVNRAISQGIKNLSSYDKSQTIKKLLYDFGFANITGLNIHYWRYAFSNNQNNPDYLFDEDIGLGICGDSFSIGKVDGAIKSAVKLSSKLFNFLKK
tara:strand:- start:282 stop:1205 length:924 start_codon:yes stop_codon:yes gene_type:complete